MHFVTGEECANRQGMHWLRSGPRSASGHWAALFTQEIPGSVQDNRKGFRVMKNLLVGLLGVAALAGTASAASATTLEDVKAKGFVQCGVNTGLAGFASPNDKGEWSGFDVD